MRILNYGAGAVGLGLDSCLLKAGISVDIIGRDETIGALRLKGLLRTGIFGDFTAEPQSFSCYSSLDQLFAGAYDYILVTTKSFDSHAAAKDIAGHPKIFNEKTKIVLCQNGWGNAEIFSSFFPLEQIYNARVITGFYRPQPNEVMITVHAESILLGSLFHVGLKELEDLCQAITKGGLPCEISWDIEKDLWAKMLYNCALNPLGAILNVPYGALGESEFSRSLMNDIIREVFSVMIHAGHKTHWPLAEDYLKVFYEKQLPPTAEHTSSTLQDIKRKKKTEIEALNGIVIQMADKLSLPVPINRTVYQIVKFIEKRNLTVH